MFLALNFLASALLWAYIERLKRQMSADRKQLDSDITAIPDKVAVPVATAVVTTLRSGGFLANPADTNYDSEEELLAAAGAALGPAISKAVTDALAAPPDGASEPPQQAA